MSLVVDDVGATHHTSQLSSMKLVQNAAEDQLAPIVPPDTTSVVPFVSAFLPWLYLVHSTDAKLLDQVLTLLAKTEGRDKACKIVQYTCKLAMALNQAKYKPVVGVFAKQLSSARRVLCLGKFLKVVNNTNDAWNEPAGWKRSAALLSATIGCAGDLGDDACWASDVKILPEWVTAYEIWIDRLWFITVVCDLPLNFSELVAAREAFLACKAAPDSVEYHNRRAKYLSLLLSQVKLSADFFHSSRKAFDWPTSSPLQDAVFGLLSASCSLIKLWKPQCLAKIEISK
ncbi:unnamed protein product [Aphanomyces euteiches]|uniref:Uncharacterized protein n=1 Tax=Aphanomyces euteiches TaxID=100861 RepID=A0A6G0WW65_9STRA|nr:hypothetical protein Ae201684_011015 [Aphanomyces euteiches]KAH9058424.1 hypothetical protein Ae201684P_005767 [Aphanomyces euteiches]KAH9145688.1 hypothetical protein AeRB84_010399 [Aphanomyces euteiches]